ncbi:MAG TPA: hypothetical protein PLX89_20710 [Verrucomicrobiota bacterium]|nr:hypothetical protein [Verrucomicrobiales bacterium]HRI15425.1 hypothetical protein [Verrucomicrobiota bacterium]
MNSSRLWSWLRPVRSLSSLFFWGAMRLKKPHRVTIETQDFGTVRIAKVMVTSRVDSPFAQSKDVSADFNRLSDVDRAKVEEIRTDHAIRVVPELLSQTLLTFAVRGFDVEVRVEPSKLDDPMYFSRAAQVPLSAPVGHGERCESDFGTVAAVEIVGARSVKF